MSNNVVGEWYFNDLLGYKGQLPSPSYGLFYLKCLMDVVAADGVISDEEQKWVIGFAAISGYPDEVIEQLKAYQPVQAREGVQILESKIDRDYVKLSRLSMIYNAFQAAGADGELPEKEVEAIAALGKKLGATDKEIEQVRALYDDDEKLRKKRASVLTPQSLETVLNEFKKHH